MRSLSAFALLTLLATDAAAQSCPATSTVAEPFGPPVSEADVGRMYTHVLTPDGRELWYFRKVGAMNTEDYRIYRSRRQGDSWSVPEQMRFGVEASDLYPSFSADGTRLVFSSYRPVPGDTSSHPNAHLYLSRREGEGWSTPVLLPASRIGFYHSGVKQLAEGTVRFVLTTPDWRTQTEHTIAWNGASFAEAMATVEPHPAKAYWRARQGDSLYVWDAIEGPRGVTLLSIGRTQANGRRGPGEYYRTDRAADGAWTTPRLVNFGIRTGAPNFGWFSADGCWFHFTRDYAQFMRIGVAAL